MTTIDGTTTDGLAIGRPAMDSPVEQFLERSLCQALEIMCFTEAAVTADTPLPLDALTARTEFSGRRSGSLELFAQPGAAAALAANFLGLDETDEPSECVNSDLLRELAGVVCGRFLSSADPTGRFEMYISSEKAGFAATDAIRQSFRLPSGDLRLVLQFS